MSKLIKCKIVSFDFLCFLTFNPSSTGGFLTLVSNEIYLQTSFKLVPVKIEPRRRATTLSWEGKG